MGYLETSWIAIPAECLSAFAFILQPPGCSTFRGAKIESWKLLLNSSFPVLQR